MTKLAKTVRDIAIVASILTLVNACSEQQPAEAAESAEISKVVAMLDGEPITDDDLDIKGELTRLAQEIYKARQEALDQVITVRVLEKEAKKAAGLRKDSKLEILISAPRLPVNIENAHRRGPADAPVTLIEFSDFQCPFCRRVQPTLESLFEEYEGQISWVYKDLPLTSIHPDAVGAAEAARCAGDQGKFWEYRDALFAESRVT